MLSGYFTIAYTSNKYLFVEEYGPERMEKCQSFTVAKKVGGDIFGELHPISLLLVMSKVWEKAIARQIKRHRKNIISCRLDNQACMTALLDFVDDILLGSDVGNEVP